MTGILRNHPSRAKAAATANSVITKSIYCAYPCLLIWLFIVNEGLTNPGSALLCTDFLKALLVPLASFALLSIFRDKLNAPRPYEMFQTPPVIAKNTKGHSFPSRHVFSIFVIAVTFLACAGSAIWGIIILCMGVLLAVLRVITGVHWPKDVIAGMIIGILCGCIEFLL
ncbi:MAG: phosphatase PAP2 family protein [Anaerotardibacter sp.]